MSTRFLSPWMLSNPRETQRGFSTIFCVGMGRLLTRFGVPQHTVHICNIVNPFDGPSVTESVTLGAPWVMLMSYQWD